MQQKRLPEREAFFVLPQPLIDLNKITAELNVYQPTALAVGKL